MTALHDLAGSTVTTDWHEPVRQLCNPTPPEPCDCGFAGDWEYRFVMVWHDGPRKATDKTVRGWLAKGWPYRNAPGSWVIGGYDERCPQCGDIERFDLDTFERVRCFDERAEIVRLP